ncbi:S28 family serine protease [Actinorugispora endophytica]|uniref:PS-10 peptidase S37 n=1 Tax=Actinorugispora endophytica TaxID=1605990 RepID=A0A4R6UW79_9ACTN|nr:S28 family serine protease [Actinorugispora endophytica]TDQ50239.1 PS-10 peptidase S37 [Actinorugispora endophytica]
MPDRRRPSPALFATALLAAAVLLLTAAPTAAAQETTEPDIRARLEAVPGLTVVEEKSVPAEGFRYFVLSFTQYTDHDRPRAGTFEQRLTLLHRGFDRPTVLHTSGYQVSTVPSRSEPTRLVDGNQISTEQRFFGTSRPDPADWDTLDIRQAAADHHRVIEAVDDVYTGAWISTGASKGGMTSVYHRRFYPHDVEGTVAYVAPNDVRDNEDSAYLEFFDTVGGSSDCQQDLEGLQREALERRGELVAHYEGLAERNGWTFHRGIGGADEALEMLVLDTAWAFWQYRGVDECGEVPGADAPTADIAAFLDEVAGFAFYTDQGIEPYVPYYFQAATQLGTPSVPTDHLDGLLRHPDLFHAANYLPPELEGPRFDRRAMPDIDRWVRTRGTRLLFVDGEYDPWSAEPFEVGRGGRRDAHSFTAPGANHGASIAALDEADRAAATAALTRWAGLDGVTPLRAVPDRIPGLDDAADPVRRPL